MGFLEELFQSRAEKFLQILEGDVNLLRIVFYGYLCQKYTLSYGQGTGTLLAVAVLNTLILQESSNDAEKQFYVDNKNRIQEEASSVHRDAVLSGCSGIASYLYASEILLGTAMIKNPQTAYDVKEQCLRRIEALEEQAASLLIWVPDSYDICGSNDPLMCIQGIHRFLDNDPH